MFDWNITMFFKMVWLVFWCFLKCLFNCSEFLFRLIIWKVYFVRIRVHFGFVPFGTFNEIQSLIPQKGGVGWKFYIESIFGCC